ncbi:hypothetical protein M5K25_000005 [Dendrobium thyrsiflorum]|uniref:Uncharacterized protein n=1 Tax=Dendrobium thyrsiflorum TaxID=117978 RepID=A0ABD0W8A2_DENTH
MLVKHRSQFTGFEARRWNSPNEWSCLDNACGEEEDSFLVGKEVHYYGSVRAYGDQRVGEHADGEKPLESELPTAPEQGGHKVGQSNVQEDPGIATSHQANKTITTPKNRKSEFVNLQNIIIPKAAVERLLFAELQHRDAVKTVVEVEKRAKGLCFRCKENDEDEDAAEEENDHLHLDVTEVSINSVVEFIPNHTMKVKGKIGHQKVVVPLPLLPPYKQYFMCQLRKVIGNHNPSATLSMT